MLERGADVNAHAGWHKNTLLAAAAIPECYEEHTEVIIQLLIDYGAGVGGQSEGEGEVYGSSPREIGVLGCARGDPNPATEIAAGD